MAGRGVICGAPGCLNAPSPYSPYCFDCLRRWSSKALPKTERPDAKLYVIAGADLVQIRVTQYSVRDRLSTLQASSPVKLALIGHVPCAESCGPIARQRLQVHRSHGEWFRREGDVVRLIEWVEHKDSRSVERWLYGDRTRVDLCAASA